jgi:hypothetical protein
LRAVRLRDDDDGGQRGRFEAMTGTVPLLAVSVSAT